MNITIEVRTEIEGDNAEALVDELMTQLAALHPAIAVEDRTLNIRCTLDVPGTIKYLDCVEDDEDDND